MFNTGDIIDNRYEVKNLLGEGGFGKVWLAEDRFTGVQVALKTVRTPINKAEALRNFWNEGKMMFNLTGHSNIVSILNFNVFTSVSTDFVPVFYIVMEFINGETALNKLEKGSLSTEDCIKIGLAVTEALKFLHHRKIIHRDIKPNNILISDDWRIKLGDLGLARDDDPNRIQTQFQHGTLPYMAPEQFEDNPISNAQSDVFQFGATLYHLFTNKYPSHNGHFKQGDKTHPKILNDEIPDTIAEMIVLMLEKEPGKRPKITKVLETFEKYGNQNSGSEDAIRKIRTALKDGVALRIDLIKREADIVPLKAGWKRKWYATLLLRPCDEDERLVNYFSPIFFAEYEGNKMTAIAHWDQNHSLIRKQLQIDKCCSGLAVRWQKEHNDWEEKYGTDYYTRKVDNNGLLEYIILHNVKDAINSPETNLVRAHYALSDKFQGVNPNIRNFVGWDLRDVNDVNKRVKMSEDIQTEIVIPLYRVDKSLSATTGNEVLGVLNFEWEENFNTPRSFEAVRAIADDLLRVARTNLLAVTKFNGQVLYHITKD